MISARVLLPITCWGLFFVLFLHKGFSTRTSFLGAAVCWGGAVTFLTEVLSLFCLLNGVSLALGWFALSLAVTPLLHGKIPKLQSLPTTSRSEKAGIAIIVAILAATFVTAVVSPPNTWDSMTYHMGRVAHWIQNGSVAHFPTSILRQVELNPWAEFAILHLHLLYGGDQLANLVQWFSMVGCVAGSSLLAKRYGGTIQAQVLAGVVAVTIPMAILQSSGTQNDLVVSFWLLCFVVFATASPRPDDSVLSTFLMAASLGLALLTKGTAYIYATPFVAFFFIRDAKASWRSAMRRYLLIGFVIMLINGGHWCRNYSLFHNPLHSGTDDYSNSVITPATLLSNVSRNVALQVWTPSGTVNRYIVNGVGALHSLVGLDTNEPGTTWASGSFSASLSRLCPFEDTSGNPLHFLLTAAATAWILLGKRGQRWRGYTLAAAGGFLLFCALLRWQPWGSRLLLPIFVLYSPVVGMALASLKAERLKLVAASVLVLASLPWVLCNISRPLVSLAPYIAEYPPSIFSIPRHSLYFVRNPAAESTFLRAASTLKGSNIKNVGIHYNDAHDCWEYPLWALTRTNGVDGPRIEHVKVTNVTRNLPGKAFHPESIVTFSKTGEVSLESPRQTADGDVCRTSSRRGKN